jgi:hypothetical protein
MNEGELISAEDALASIRLIDSLIAYKRRRSVPDEVIGAMEVLDRQLDQNLGPAPPDDELR